MRFKQTTLAWDTQAIRNNHWILIDTIRQPDFNNTKVFLWWNGDAINTWANIYIFSQTLPHQTIW